jgi:type IV secretory pathway TraG/TraD family ATPase VirD4
MLREQVADTKAQLTILDSARQIAALPESNRPLVALMTAQDIKQLGDEEILDFHRRLPPFRARRMDWRRFDELVKRRRIPAPQLRNLPELEDLLMAAWPERKPPLHILTPTWCSKERKALTAVHRWPSVSSSVLFSWT